MAQNFTLAYQCLSPWQKEVLGEPWGHCVRNMKGQEEGREEQSLNTSEPHLRQGFILHGGFSWVLSSLSDSLDSDASLCHTQGLICSPFTSLPSSPPALPPSDSHPRMHDPQGWPISSISEECFWVLFLDVFGFVFVWSRALLTL